MGAPGSAKQDAAFAGQGGAQPTPSRKDKLARNRGANCSTHTPTPVHVCRHVHTYTTRQANCSGCFHMYTPTRRDRQTVAVTFPYGRSHGLADGFETHKCIQSVCPKPSRAGRKEGDSALGARRPTRSCPLWSPRSRLVLGACGSSADGSSLLLLESW